MLNYFRAPAYRWWHSLEIQKIVIKTRNKNENENKNKNKNKNEN